MAGGDAAGGGTGGTTAGSSGGPSIGTGVGVVAAVRGAGVFVDRRGAGVEVALRARVAGAGTAREVGRIAGGLGGAPIASTTEEPGGRAGSGRDWPSVSQPISAHSNA